MNKKRGFTLFELLVSISIIGILIAIASVSFSSAQKKARDARRMEDMSAVSKAAESYYSLSSYVYPSDTNPWAISGTGETILSMYPRDPKRVGWTAYVYGGGTTYYACAAVENRSNGNSANNRGVVGAGGTGPFYCVKSLQ